MVEKELIDMILDFQNQENGSFSLADNKTVSVDMTAMALQALVPYNTRANIQKYRLRLKRTGLSEGQMLSDCGFYVEGRNNSCSAAQVLMLLCEAGIDPLDPDNGLSRQSHIDNKATISSWKADIRHLKEAQRQTVWPHIR